MISSPLRRAVLAEYRRQREYFPPLTAIGVVRNASANAICSLLAQGLASAAGLELPMWQEVNLVADEIALRRMRTSPVGDYWTTGNCRPPRPRFELWDMDANPTHLVTECPTASCAFKHALDYFRFNPDHQLKIIDGNTGRMSDEFGSGITIHDIATIQRQFS